ncbi:Tetratricopeptide repeat-containing protein [Parapedobacter indicus]|uniref:Tetratricopeptide repeat-containing protein n=2 Tax=Parapedobacter indicus TaxID=1477437 RepID=A0A1I3J497_9SPHI|nr:tetratricopeptide repeat protein [Parapedobacter indicus]SFI55111.1 Tetratricopeptide repeat-containing protein [Parapedobacter indicus]
MEFNTEGQIVFACNYGYVCSTEIAGMVSQVGILFNMKVMKRNELSFFLGKSKRGIIGGMLCLAIFTAQAQTTETAPSNPNVRLGQKALIDGDFKAAANHLQKALPAESGDPDVMYMLGYSQYQIGEYKKALASFGKVIQLRPDHESAYYYRGKANNILAVQTDLKISSSSREKMLNEALADYTKAIELNAGDVKYYQNRGIAYRDLGILRGTSGTANYDKALATEAYDKSIADFEQVLTMTPGKKDIQTEVKKAKVYRDNLK